MTDCDSSCIERCPQPLRAKEPRRRVLRMPRPPVGSAGVAARLEQATWRSRAARAVPCSGEIEDGATE